MTIQINSELSESDERLIAVLIHQMQDFYVHAEDRIYPISYADLIRDYESFIEDDFINESPSFDEWLNDHEQSCQESFDYEWDSAAKTLGDYYVMTLDEVDAKYEAYLDDCCDTFESEVHTVLHQHFSSKHHQSNVPFYFPLNREMYRRDFSLETNYGAAVTGDSNSTEDIVAYKDECGYGIDLKFYVYKR